VTKKPPPPPPIIAVPPDTTLNGAYIEVKKEEPVAVTSMKSPVITDYTPRPHSEGVLRFLLLAMGVGFLVMTVGLIRLDYRITGIEKKLTFAGLNREPLHSELPGTATSSPASDSPTERVLPKETTANDKLILGDNPVTKTHPLLPVPATQATQRVKSGRNLKTSGKDAAKGKSGNNRRRSAKKALAPQTEAVNPNTAPANKTKIEP
jgi:hypothetical protein